MIFRSCRQFCRIVNTNDNKMHNQITRFSWIKQTNKKTTKNKQLNFRWLLLLWLKMRSYVFSQSVWKCYFLSFAQINERMNLTLLTEKGSSMWDLSVLNSALVHFNRHRGKMRHNKYFSHVTCQQGGCCAVVGTSFWRGISDWIFTASQEIRFFFLVFELHSKWNLQ